MRKAVEIGLLVVLVAVITHLSAPRSATWLRLDSPPGEYIGQGKVTRCSEPGYAFCAQRIPYGPLGVEVLVQGAGPVDRWRLTFCAPGKRPLRPGTYENAARFPFHGENPGLECSGQGRGNNKLAGRFTIHELEMEGDTVVRFAADFEQRGESQPLVLKGKVRYRSSIP
ncbi:MAG: hypothetical protein AB1758_17205 [Candidatus Eremiobacterota bacterium]